MANPTTPTRRDDAKQFGTDVKNKAQETASGVTDKAKEMASNVGHRAEEATSSVASGMKSLAGTVRENLPHEGMMGRASSAVADSLESGGRYLQEEGLSGMADDLTNLIRRNPIPAMLVGIGIGFLLARVTRS